MSDDVVAALADITVGSPLNGTVEVAGPDQFNLDDLVRRALKAAGDAREVITDGETRYFGAKLNEQTLTPDARARIGTTHYEDWERADALQPHVPRAATDDQRRTRVTEAKERIAAAIRTTGRRRGSRRTT